MNNNNKLHYFCSHFLKPPAGAREHEKIARILVYDVFVGLLSIFLEPIRVQLAG